MKGTKMGTCSVCNDVVEKYGIDQQNNITCYPCCGKHDKADMIKTGKAVLYLTIKNSHAIISNWPNSLVIPCTHYKIGRHNIAGKRYDVWFVFNSYVWHGVTYGDFTQLCHCKRTKQVV